MWPLSLGVVLLCLSYWPLRVPTLPLLILFVIPLSASAAELSDLQQQWADEPNNLQVAEELSFALLQQGKSHEARLILEHVAQKGDAEQKSRALYNAGLAAYQEGLLDQAASYFQKASQIKEDWAEAQANHRAILEEIARRKDQEQQNQQQEQQDGGENNEDQDQQEGEQQEQEGEQQEQQDGEESTEEQQEGEQQEQEGEQQEQEGEEQEQSSEEGQEQPSEEDFAQQQDEEEKDLNLDQLEGANAEESTEESTEEQAAQADQMRAEQGEQVVLSEDEQLLDEVEEARPRWVYGEGTGGNKEW